MEEMPIKKSQVASYIESRGFSYSPLNNNLNFLAGDLAKK